MSAREPIPAGPGTLSVSVAAVSVPDHVVYRRFPSETVVLNLHTGTYHGLNATAGRMLEVLDDVHDVSRAIGVLGAELDCPASQLQRDVHDLCDALLARGLLSVEHERAG